MINAMRPGRLLVGVAALCAACGDDTGSVVDSVPTAAEVASPGTTTEMHATTSTTAMPTSSEQPSTTSAVAESTTSDVLSGGQSATIDTEFGSVNYAVPAGSFVDPRPPTSPPDFALGQARWIVQDRYNIGVTLQNIEPPFPDESLVDTFVANDIEWNVYDIGPQNGTVTVARGTAGPITILVGVQGWTFDPSTHPTLPATAAITRSVVVDLAEA
jgi:hypothetical protein